MSNSLRGICLAAPDIRSRIKEGLVSGGSVKEEQIQPSSLEPTLEDEVFILDTEGQGVMRPVRHESVYRTLLALPGRARQRHSIFDGFEIKRGFTY